MKMHVVYDPNADCPRCVEVTDANVNDVEIGRQVEIEAGATYVFDKGYYHFGWWKKINDAKALFVTRVKSNTRLRATKRRYVRKVYGDGFKILEDAEVVLTSKGNSRLPIPLRRIKVKRDKGGTITLITNDLDRTAGEIAQLYKTRWQIELLFRWIKQHLDIRKFLGVNENAIRLQVLAAMIAYLLLRIAVRVNRVKIPVLRFAELVCQRIFMRRPISDIDKPPPVNPSKAQLRWSTKISWNSPMLEFSPDSPAACGERVGVRGNLDETIRGKSPSPGPLRGPTSPHKRGEVNRASGLGRFNQLVTPAKITRRLPRRRPASTTARAGRAVRSAEARFPARP